MEYLSFYVRIDRTVHKFDGILHKCLVFRMTDSGRIYCAIVELSKSGKLFIYYGFVAVAFDDCRLEIVRNNGHRSTAIKAQGIFTSKDEVLLLL